MEDLSLRSAYDQKNQENSTSIRNNLSLSTPESLRVASYALGLYTHLKTQTQYLELQKLSRRVSL